jgi:nucleotide-binding universal stress UspA family protein
MPISDAFAFDEGHEEAMRNQIKKIHEQMDELVKTLKKEVSEGKLSDIKLITKFREGVPEEQILNYSKKHQPLITIMGTHGLGSKEDDLMGSVTADIIERSRVPVFAFPQDMPFFKFEDIRNIGFMTNFDQRDLVAFDSMMHLLKPYRFKVYFIHLTSDPDKWDEIKLTGIKDYFKKQYPEIDSSYCMIKGGGDMLEGLNEFFESREIDVITVTSQKRNIFTRLFNPSFASKMLFHSHMPLLVLRG